MPRGCLFWGRFWLAFSSFFYDSFLLFCFLLFLRCAAPWKATRKPKRLPRAPPEAPEAPQGLPNGTPRVPKSTRRGFQKAPDRLTRAHEYPKRIHEAFSRTLKFPRWPQDVPTSTSGGTQENTQGTPREPKRTPRENQEVFRAPQEHPKPDKTEQERTKGCKKRREQGFVPCSRVSRVTFCPV